MCVAAAIVGGSVVGGIANSVTQSKAASKAANAQTNAANQALQAQYDATQEANTALRDYYGQIRADNKQWYDTGARGNNRLAYMLGLSGDPVFQNQAANDEVRRIMAAENINYEDAANRVAKGWNAAYDPNYGSLTRNFTTQDFYSDPVTQLGFQFGLDEGTKGLNRAAAANGGLDSGATLKALTRYATDYTGTKANDSFNRYQTQNTNTFNKLANLSGIGQNAANTITGATQNVGNQIAANARAYGNAAAGTAQDIGNARASSAIASGNAWSNGIGGVTNALTGYGGYGGGGYGGATSYPVTDYYSGVVGTPLY